MPFRVNILHQTLQAISRLCPTIVCLKINQCKLHVTNYLIFCIMPLGHTCCFGQWKATWPHDCLLSAFQKNTTKYYREMYVSVFMWFTYVKVCDEPSSIPFWSGVSKKKKASVKTTHCVFKLWAHSYRPAVTTPAVQQHYEVIDIYCNTMGPLVGVYYQHHDWRCLIFSTAFHLPTPNSSGMQQVPEWQKWQHSHFLQM